MALCSIRQYPAGVGLGRGGLRHRYDLAGGWQCWRYAAPPATPTGRDRRRPTGRCSHRKARTNSGQLPKFGRGCPGSQSRPGYRPGIPHKHARPRAAGAASRCARPSRGPAARCRSAAGRLRRRAPFLAFPNPEDQPLSGFATRWRAPLWCVSRWYPTAPAPEDHGRISSRHRSVHPRRRGRCLQMRDITEIQHAEQRDND